MVAYFLALQRHIYGELVMVIGDPELYPICRNVVYLGKKLIHVVVVCYGRTMGRVKKNCEKAGRLTAWGGGHPPPA